MARRGRYNTKIKKELYKKIAPYILGLFFIGNAMGIVMVIATDWRVIIGSMIGTLVGIALCASRIWKHTKGK